MGALIEKHGNLFDYDVIAHGCNSKGVMGSGVARVIRELYPEAYDAYRNTSFCLGSNSYVATRDGGLVVNMITQENYGRDNVRYVNYEAIAECFEGAAHWLPRTGYYELYIPKIGAGLANGNWRIIRTIIEETIKYTPLNVTVLIQ